MTALPEPVQVSGPMRPRLLLECEDVLFGGEAVALSPASGGRRNRRRWHEGQVRYGDCRSESVCRSSHRSGSYPLYAGER